MRIVRYYAKIRLDDGETRTGETKRTEAEAREDLDRLMKLYHVNGGYVETYVW